MEYFPFTNHQFISTHKERLSLHSISGHLRVSIVTVRILSVSFEKYSFMTEPVYVESEEETQSVRGISYLLTESLLLQ